MSGQDSVGEIRTFTLNGKEDFEAMILEDTPTGMVIRVISSGETIRLAKAVQ